MLQTAVRERVVTPSQVRPGRRATVIEHLCINTYQELGHKDYGWLFVDGY